MATRELRITTHRRTLERMNADSHLLAVGEVAARLHVGPATVRRWINAGELPAVRYGRTIRVDADDLGARTFGTSVRGPHPDAERLR
jgi:excisionase family DNA binding protein